MEIESHIFSPLLAISFAKTNNFEVELDQIRKSLKNNGYKIGDFQVV